MAPRQLIFRAELGPSGPFWDEEGSLVPADEVVVAPALRAALQAWTNEYDIRCGEPTYWDAGLALFQQLRAELPTVVLTWGNREHPGPS